MSLLHHPSGQDVSMDNVHHLPHRAPANHFCDVHTHSTHEYRLDIHLALASGACPAWKSDSQSDLPHLLTVLSSIMRDKSQCPPYQ